MRKLSSIKGAEGMKVMGGLLPVISRMIKNSGPKEGNALEYLGKMLESCPEDAIALVAIIDGVDVEEYNKKNFMEIMKDVTSLVSDSELLGLFGLQMQTPTSSTSASENSEVRN